MSSGWAPTNATLRGVVNGCKANGGGGRTGRTCFGTTARLGAHWASCLPWRLRPQFRAKRTPSETRNIVSGNGMLCIANARCCICTVPGALALTKMPSAAAVAAIASKQMQALDSLQPKK